MEFDSPCNSSSRLNLSYNGVILAFSIGKSSFNEKCSKSFYFFTEKSDKQVS